MRHVSRTHRVALDLLCELIWTPKSKSNTSTPKTNSQTLTKGNFTRDEWDHLLTLFNISHFSSTACTAAMAKRAQQGSGEERVTAKSRRMMNLTARMPSVVSSSTSNPGRTSHGYQDSGKSVASDDISGKPEQPSRPDYTQEDYGSWSSQEWKSGAAEHDRSEKPEEISWDILQKSCPSSWGTSSRQACAFCKVRRDDSRWIGETWDWVTKNRPFPKISSWTVTQQNLWTKSKTKCEKDRMSNVAESGE